MNFPQDNKIQSKSEDNREAIYGLIEQQEQLEESTRKKVRKFVDRFYDVIDNPKKVYREITSQCI